MIIKSFNLSTANEIKIVELIGGGYRGYPRIGMKKLKTPYYKTTIYTKISQDKFHTESKDIKETKVFESSIDDVESHICEAIHWLRYCYPYLDYNTNNFYDDALFELYVDGDQVLDEVKIKRANYLKELYHNLIEKYSPENIKIVRKIYGKIYGLIRDGENLSSDNDVKEYFIKNGINKLRGVGKKQFKDFIEYFDLKMYEDEDIILGTGDVIIKLEWDEFECKFCKHLPTKYKINEVFRKTEDGTWISVSGKHTNLSDEDIQWIKSNVLSRNGKVIHVD